LLNHSGHVLLTHGQTLSYRHCQRLYFRMNCEYLIGHVLFWHKEERWGECELSVCSCLFCSCACVLFHWKY